MSTYQIDPSHSSATFSIKHMMIAKVHGGFEKMSGTLNYDAAAPTKASVEVVIEANSINTREEKREVTMNERAIRQSPFKLGVNLFRHALGAGENECRFNIGVLQ